MSGAVFPAPRHCGRAAGETVRQCRLARSHGAAAWPRSNAGSVPRSVYIPGGWLMSWHIRSVRARILLLVLVPVLSLFGLYLFTTGIAGKDALNLARARALKTATSEPVSNFLGQLDTERVFSAIYLSAPSPGNLAKLHAQEAATGHVTAALRAALTSGSTLSNAPPAVRQASATLLHDAAGLRRPARLDRRTDGQPGAGTGHIQQADQRLLPAAEPGDPHRDQHADRRAGAGA